MKTTLILGLTVLLGITSNLITFLRWDFLVENFELIN
jgi:hypothetical protein